MEFKSSYLYWILGGLSLVFLFVDQSTTELPTLATVCAMFTMLIMAADQSWKAFKRCGKACIVTSLKPDEGGHSTMHPDDLSLAVSPSDEHSILPNFAVFASGGFVHGGVEWQGGENFFVCPPEHIEPTGAALICRTRFRRVDYDELPDYVQGELLKLKFFSKRTVKIQDNLWFGMTSKIDGTSTTKMLSAESDFLDQTSVINQLKKLLRDKHESEQRNTKSQTQPIYLNMDR